MNKSPLKKCKNPDCTISFAMRENKTFCSIKCKNAFHRALNREMLNANNREIAKMSHAGKTLKLLRKRMELYNMPDISAETLILFEIPMTAATKIVRNDLSGSAIHWFGTHGISAIDKSATRYEIHVR